MYEKCYINKVALPCLDMLPLHKPSRTIRSSETHSTAFSRYGKARGCRDGRGEEGREGFNFIALLYCEKKHTHTILPYEQTRMCVRM